MDANKLYEAIKNDPNLKRYHQLEQLFNDNKDIQKQMFQLKELQKQLINAKHIGKEQLIKSLEESYQGLLDQLHETPLLDEYLELQSYFNDVMKSITDILENEINMSFNETKVE